MSIEDLWAYALERGIDEQPLSVVITKYKEHLTQKRIEMLMDQITESLGDSEAVVSLDSILKTKKELRKLRKAEREAKNIGI
jgi:hypothetical protein